MLLLNWCHQKKNSPWLQENRCSPPNSSEQICSATQNAVRIPNAHQYKLLWTIAPQSQRTSRPLSLSPSFRTVNFVPYCIHGQCMNVSLPRRFPNTAVLEWAIFLPDVSFRTKSTRFFCVSQCCRQPAAFCTREQAVHGPRSASNTHVHFQLDGQSEKLECHLNTASVASTREN